MGKNTIRKTFNGDGTWVAPAGVTKVRVYTSSVLGGQFSGETTRIAISSDGVAHAWGSNVSGQIGDGTVVPKSSPVAVLGGFLWRTVVSAAGGNFCLGVDLTGTLYAWGANNSGKLGLGDVTPRSSPVLVLGGIKFRFIAASVDSAAGIAVNGSLYTWGLNAQGQLGLGDVTPRSSPVLVSFATGWESISVGRQSMVAVNANGNAYAWGDNQKGELGVGDVTPRSTPTLVLGGKAWSKVSAPSGATAGTAQTSAGVDKLGNAYAWGNNANGQLGDGTVVAKSSPVAVLGGLKFRDIGVNETSVLAITTAGALYSWGLQANGGLGVGDVTPRSSPVAVLGGFTYTAIAHNGTAAIRDNNFLYAWGANGNGQIGDGTVVSKSSPILVLGTFVYRTVNETSVNTTDFAVVPGQSYSVKVFGGNTSFGGAGQYQDPYSVGAVPTKITLEYEA